MKIRVDPEQLQTIAEKFWAALSEIDEVGNMISRADNQLDVGSFEGSTRAHFESNIGTATTKLRSLQTETSDLAQFLESAAQRFADADNEDLQSISNLFSNAPQGPLTGLLPGLVGVGGFYGLGALAGNYMDASSSTELSWVNTSLEPSFSSDLFGLTREHKIFPERRGRPRDFDPSVKVTAWEDELWEAPENSGSIAWGGLRLGGETHVKVGGHEGGIKAGLDDGDLTIGPYIGGTIFAVGASGVIGSTDAGLAGGIDVKAGEAEAFIGVKDGSVGAKIGGKIVSAEATVGGNINGTYVGVVGGIGLEFELGISIGKKTRIDLGPFTIGLDIGKAKGA